jgi:rhodanese-related sulfurtransferase
MDRSIDAGELKQLIEARAPVTVLDLRRASDYDADTGIVPGARRFEHEKIEHWSQTLPREGEIVLYCAHGRTISNAALDFLLARGYKARYIEDGMDGWKAAGGAVAAKP